MLFSTILSILALSAAGAPYSPITNALRIQQGNPLLPPATFKKSSSTGRWLPPVSKTLTARSSQVSGQGISGRIISTGASGSFYVQKSGSAYVLSTSISTSTLFTIPSTCSYSPLTSIEVQSDATAAFGAAVGELSSVSAVDIATAQFNLRAAQVALIAAQQYSVVQSISFAQLEADAKVSAAAYAAANLDNTLISDPYLAAIATAATAAGAQAYTACVAAALQKQTAITAYILELNPATDEAPAISLAITVATNAAAGNDIPCNSFSLPIRLANTPATTQANADLAYSSMVLGNALLVIAQANYDSQQASLTVLIAGAKNSGNSVPILVSGIGMTASSEGTIWTVDCNLGGQMSITYTNSDGSTLSPRILQSGTALIVTGSYAAYLAANPATTDTPISLTFVPN